MIRTNALECPMRWTAGAHVVFCVHLEEAGQWSCSTMPGRCWCLKLVPTSAAVEQDGKRRRVCGADGLMWPTAFIKVVSAFQLMSIGYDAVSEPCLPPGTTMFAQVPPCTNFQELP